MYVCDRQGERLERESINQRRRCSIFQWWVETLDVDQFTASECKENDLHTTHPECKENDLQIICKNACWSKNVLELTRVYVWRYWDILDILSIDTKKTSY